MKVGPSVAQEFLEPMRDARLPKRPAPAKVTKKATHHSEFVGRRNGDFELVVARPATAPQKVLKGIGRQLAIEAVDIGSR
jgi:hypothetical protein